jgi:hypothetical protein
MCPPACIVHARWRCTIAAAVGQMQISARRHAPMLMQHKEIEPNTLDACGRDL